MKAFKTKKSFFLIISTLIVKYSAFIEYLNGLNMTENQYWESVKPAYKKFISCGKLKNSMKQKYAEDNNIKDKIKLDKEFRLYYSKFLSDLKIMQLLSLK